jgi:hypothetical protein
VNEAEWLACRDPRAMLDYLKGKTSARKLRLFAAACCRRIWRLLTDPRSRDAVEVAERYADGQATDAELAEAVKAAQSARYSPRTFSRLPGTLPPDGIASNAVACAAYAAAQGNVTDAAVVVQAALRSASGAMARRSTAPGFVVRALVHGSTVAVEVAERAAQCRLARDCWGNPFRTIEVKPAWRAANGAAVARLARALYDERDFDQLPVLADALEDAGCDSNNILEHLRRPGPHVRGCWALDLILGRS